MSLVLGEGNIGDSMSSELRERKRKRRYEYAGPRYPSQLEEEETRYRHVYVVECLVIPSQPARLSVMDAFFGASIVIRRRLSSSTIVAPSFSI